MGYPLKMEKRRPREAHLTPLPEKSIGTVRVSVGWPMVLVACSSARRFPASCFRRRSPRGLIALKSSRRCKIASGRTRMYTERVRSCPAGLFLPQQTTFLFQTEIMGDDDDEDGESPTQVPSPDSGDAVPASPAIHPAQSPSNQVSPKPA